MTEADASTIMSSEDFLRLAEEALRLCLNSGLSEHELSPQVETPTWRRQGSSRSSTPEYKTTLMLRNIPNKFTRDQLVKIIMLKMGKPGSFDFFYLPTDFRSKCNFGYAFINMTSCENVDKFFQVFDGANLTSFINGILAGSSNSNPRYSKICQVTFARVQGLDENVRRLMNSPIMGAANVLEGASQEEIDASLPILFDSVTGKEIPFPRPDPSELPTIMNPRASASLAAPPHRKPVHSKRQNF